MRWLKAVIARFRTGTGAAMPIPPVGLALPEPTAQLGSSSTALDTNRQPPLASQPPSLSSAPAPSITPEQRPGKKTPPAQPLAASPLKAAGAESQAPAPQTHRRASQAANLSSSPAPSTLAAPSAKPAPVLVQTPTASPSGVPGPSSEPAPQILQRVSRAQKAVSKAARRTKAAAKRTPAKAAARTPTVSRAGGRGK